MRIPAALREASGGESALVVPVDAPATVGAVLDTLAATHPALERRLRDELRRVRAHVNLFVGADNIRDVDGIHTVVPAGGELTIIAAVSGG